MLVPEKEFTSNLFPWLVQRGRGIRVRTVPAHELSEAIDESVDVVAFSIVQSATGEVADVDAVVAAAQDAGAHTVADATQAGWWAGDDPHDSYYGPPLRMAGDARRLDLSPAWFSWVGTAGADVAPMSPASCTRAITRAG